MMHMMLITVFNNSVAAVENPAHGADRESFRKHENKRFPLRAFIRLSFASPSLAPHSSDQQLNCIPVTRFSFERVSAEFTPCSRSIGWLNVAIPDRLISRARVSRINETTLRD